MEKSQIDFEYDYVSPQRQKAREISQEKIFGWQPFSEEQILKQRNAIGHILNEFQANLTGGLGSLADLLGLKNQSNVNKMLFPGLSQLVEVLPTVEERRQKLRPSFTEQDYQPSETIQRFGQGAGLLGSGLSTPIPGTNLARLAFGATATPIVGLAAKKMGAPDWAQTGLEMLTLVGSSLYGKPSILETQRNLYRQADRLLPRNASVNTTNLHNWAQALYNRLSRRGHDPETAVVLRKLEDIIQGTQAGTTNVNQLKDWRTSINSIMGDPATLKGTRRLLPRITQNLNRFMNRYGQTNPIWLEAQRRADTFHAGLENSNRLTRFLEAKVNVNNPLTWLAFGAKKTLGAAATASGAKVLTRILTNPEMRRYYNNVIRYASQREAKMAQYYTNKLEKKIENEFPAQQNDEEYDYIYPK